MVANIIKCFQRRTGHQHFETGAHTAVMQSFMVGTVSWVELVIEWPPHAQTMLDTITGVAHITRDGSQVVECLVCTMVSAYAFKRILFLGVKKNNCFSLFFTLS